MSVSHKHKLWTKQERQRVLARNLLEKIVTVLGEQVPDHSATLPPRSLEAKQKHSIKEGAEMRAL